MDKNEQLLSELKEALPKILALKTELEGKTVDPAVLKGLQDQCAKLSGDVLSLGSQLQEIKRVDIKAGKLSEEAELDFLKYFVGFVKQSNSPSVETSAQLKDIYKKWSAKATQNETTAADGGLLVPTLFLKYIWNVGKQASVILTDAMKMPLTKGFKLPLNRILANVAVAWEAESAALNETSATLQKSDLEAKKLAAYTIITNELIEDEPIEAMDDNGATTTAQWLLNLFGEAMGEEIDNQGFTGTGSPITGILGATGLNTVNMANGLDDFSDITGDHLSSMIAATPTTRLSGAKFYMHPSIFHYVRTLKAATTNEYIFQAMQAANGGTIWGYPVQLVDKMPASTATADSTGFVVFGNLGKSFAVGTKGEMSMIVSKELRMLTDETVIAVRRRIAMVTALPGALTKLVTGTNS